MKTRKLVLQGFIVAIASVLTMNISCKKGELDKPPVIDFSGRPITVAQLRAMWPGYPKVITDTICLFATVTMDDKTGNLYKSAYVQDSTGGIFLKLTDYPSLSQNDYVKINLRGLTISDYKGVRQLDSVQMDRDIIKQKIQYVIQPKKITLFDLNITYEGKLVQFTSAEFLDAEKGNTWADALTQANESHFFGDCTAATPIEVRTSGYAKFAGKVLPEGHGTIIGVVSYYNDTPQLLLRTPDEADMDSTRCDGSHDVNSLFEETFDMAESSMEINFSGWINIAEKGTKKWFGNDYLGEKSAGMSTLNTDSVNTVWLITPSIDLDNSAAETLTFMSQDATNSGAALKVYVSNNYDGGTSPQNATWTQLTCTIASGSTGSYGPWVASGDVDLSAYTGTVHIAFKYEGSFTTGLKGYYGIDNVKVRKTQ